MFRLNHLFKRADAVQRHLAAPLARSRLAYLAHRAEQGARSSTLRGIAALQVKVIHYLELGEQGKVARPDIEAAARRWASQDPARRGGNADIAQRHFVSHATCWLRFLGRLEDSAISTHPHSGVVADFVDYMRQERGWSEATIRDRRARADDFLRRFCETTGALAEVTIATIDRALSENNARTGRPRCRTTIRTHADALRAFFRFAEDRGWSRPGVAAAIVVPRVYRDAALPVGPSWGEQRLLLASTESDCPADLRDRALLLTLSAYGLRVGEVCALQLDDIDWEAETLRVRRPKTGRVDLFPLSRRVGEALARYLRHARPHTDVRKIFLALTAPTRPLSASAISSVVRSRMQRCDIKCPRRGAHALRHAFAQRLLDEGFPMQEIGDCLGHRSLDSTAVYAKVALAGLRPRTRNQRLAAIRTFARFVATRSPEHVEWCGRIRAIALKKTAPPAVSYLEKHELDALLDVPDTSTPQGRRERALLLFLYHTGARASEAAQLRVGGLQLADKSADHSRVTLLGKGGKTRLCPLLRESARALADLVAGRDPGAAVFLNRLGRPITRSGIRQLVERCAAKATARAPSLNSKKVGPHVLRHTAATHMLRSGVDLNTIRAWLGHASLDTTSVYAEIDIERKAKAVALFDSAEPARNRSYRDNRGLMAYLQSL